MHHGRIAALALAGLGGPLPPLLRGRANALNHPLDLSGPNADAAGLLQVPLGFEAGGLIGPFRIV